jgi:hypothetical protein
MHHYAVPVHDGSRACAAHVSCNSTELMSTDYSGLELDVNRSQLYSSVYMYFPDEVFTILNNSQIYQQTHHTADIPIQSDISLLSHLNNINK